MQIMHRFLSVDWPMHYRHFNCMSQITSESSGSRTYVLKLALQPSNPWFGLNNIRGDGRGPYARQVGAWVG